MNKHQIVKLRQEHFSTCSAADAVVILRHQHAVFRFARGTRFDAISARNDLHNSAKRAVTHVVIKFENFVLRNWLARCKANDLPAALTFHAADRSNERTKERPHGVRRESALKDVDEILPSLVFLFVVQSDWFVKTKDHVATPTVVSDLSLRQRGVPTNPRLDDVIEKCCRIFWFRFEEGAFAILRWIEWQDDSVELTD